MVLSYSTSLFYLKPNYEDDGNKGAGTHGGEFSLLLFLYNIALTPAGVGTFSMGLSPLFEPQLVKFLTWHSGVAASDANESVDYFELAADGKGWRFVFGALGIGAVSLVHSPS